MGSSSQAKVQPINKKPRYSESFNDNSRIHNKKGKGRQRFLREADERAIPEDE